MILRNIELFSKKLTPVGVSINLRLGLFPTDHKVAEISMCRGVARGRGWGLEPPQSEAQPPLSPPNKMTL